VENCGVQVAGWTPAGARESLSQWPADETLFRDRFQRYIILQVGLWAIG
jgi:hypothetical protein